MMEIKFRAWNIVDKTMYTDAINNCKDSFDMILKHPQIYRTMQFTRLKDKNDVEIYEGDIVTANWYDYEEPNSTITGEVIFNKGWLAYCIWDEENKVMSEINGKGCYAWDIEVIGNIYKNGDLLNGQ